MMDWLEICLRLGVATAAGGMIGLNRDLRGKPTGLRTLGLVALGPALLVVSGVNAGMSVENTSRIMQGVLVGVGFIGAGVIYRDVGRTRGLTTAAAIWVTACIGVVSGLGAWRELFVALVLIAFLLIVGGPIERKLHRHLYPEDPDEPDLG